MKTLFRFYPREHKVKGNKTKQIKMHSFWQRTLGVLHSEGRRPVKKIKRKWIKGGRLEKASCWKRR